MRLLILSGGRAKRAGSRMLSRRFVRAKEDGAGVGGGGEA